MLYTRQSIEEEDEDAVLRQPNQDAAAAAQLDNFWGWDLVGPQGLLDRVLASLQVPSRSWQGLKRVCT